MWDTIGGYIFCLILGLLSLAVAGLLLASGQVVQSIDNLFLVLVCLLFAVICFGYLGWRFWQIMSANGDQQSK
jgi:hypothetical protein